MILAHTMAAYCPQCLASPDDSCADGPMSHGGMVVEPHQARIDRGQEIFNKPEEPMRLAEQPRDNMTQSGAQTLYEYAALQIALVLIEDYGLDEREVFSWMTSDDYRVIVRRVYKGHLLTPLAAEMVWEDREFSL